MTYMKINVRAQPRGRHHDTGLYVYTVVAKELYVLCPDDSPVKSSKLHELPTPHQHRLQPALTLLIGMLHSPHC